MKSYVQPMLIFLKVFPKMKEGVSVTTLTAVKRKLSRVLYLQKSILGITKDNTAMNGLEIIPLSHASARRFL